MNVLLPADVWLSKSQYQYKQSHYCYYKLDVITTPEM